MALSFTIADLDQALKDLAPQWADSASFTVRRTSAAKQALAQYYKALRDSNDTWARADTLSGTAPSTGAAKVTTTNGDVFEIALVTGALSVADDSIFLSQGTTEFQIVPRMNIASILQGSTPTKYAFYENNGFIILITDDSGFTPPGVVHYSYWRTPTIDTSISTNPVDVRPEDFTAFVASVLSYLAGS